MRKLKILFSLAAVTLILNGSILPVKAEGENKDNNLSSSSSSETASDASKSDASNANTRSNDAPPLELREKSRGILKIQNEEELNKVADEVLASLKSHREVEGAKEEDLEQIRKMKLDMLKAPTPNEEQKKVLMKAIAKFDNAILKANSNK